MSDLINIGTRTVQGQHRVLLGKETCDARGIEIGKQVEVFVKKVAGAEHEGAQ